MTYIDPPQFKKIGLTVMPRLERQELQPDTLVKISILTNRHVFLLWDALIIQTPQKPETPFHLVVMNHGRVLKNEFYSSVRGARIAFARQFPATLHDENVIPEWTAFYPPEKEWLKEKMARVNPQGFGE